MVVIIEWWLRQERGGTDLVIKFSIIILFFTFNYSQKIFGQDSSQRLFLKHVHGSVQIEEKGVDLVGPKPLAEAFKEGAALPSNTSVAIGNEGSVVLVFDGSASLVLLANSKVGISYDEARHFWQINHKEGLIRVLSAQGEGEAINLQIVSNRGMFSLGKGNDVIVRSSGVRTDWHNYGSKITVNVAQPDQKNPDGSHENTVHEKSGNISSLVLTAQKLAIRDPLSAEEEATLREKLGTDDLLSLKEELLHPTAVSITQAEYAQDQQQLKQTQTRELPKLTFKKEIVGEGGTTLGLLADYDKRKNMFSLNLALQYEQAEFSTNLLTGTVASYGGLVELFARPLPWIYGKVGLLLANRQADLYASEAFARANDLVAASFFRSNLGFGLRYTFAQKIELMLGMTYRSGTAMTLVVPKFVEDNFVYSVQLASAFGTEFRLNYTIGTSYQVFGLVSTAKTPVNVSGLATGGESNDIANHRWYAIGLSRTN